MYHYEFLKNDEKMLYENPKGMVDVGEKNYDLSVVVTNKNILLFNNANKFNILIGRGIQIQPEYYLELTIPLTNLDYSVEDNNTYIMFNDTDIVIYNFNIEEFLN